MLKLVSSNNMWRDDVKAARYPVANIKNMRDRLLKLREDVDNCVIVDDCDDQEVFKSDIIIMAHKLERFLTSADAVIVPLTVIQELNELLDWGYELMSDDPYLED